MLLLLACTSSEPTPEAEPAEAPAPEKPDRFAEQLAEICRVDAMGLGRAPDPGELVEMDRPATGIPAEALQLRVTSAWVEVDGERVFDDDLMQMLKDRYKELEKAYDGEGDMPRPAANVFVSREVLPEDLSPVLKELAVRYDARFVARTKERSPRPADWTTYERVLTDMERGDGPEAIARAVSDATARCPEVANVLSEASVRRDCGHLQSALKPALDGCGGKVDADAVLSLLHVSLLPPAEEPLLAGWVVPLDCDEGTRIDLKGPWDTGYRAVVDREGKPTCF